MVFLSHAIACFMLALALFVLMLRTCLIIAHTLLFAMCYAKEKNETFCTKSAKCEYKTANRLKITKHYRKKR